MQYLKFLFIGLTASLIFASCDKDDDDNHGHSGQGDFEYHAHIMQPDSSNKKIDDTMHIHVDFEDHKGGTVHHINISITKDNGGDVVYSQPDVAHVHEESGMLSFHDNVILSVANGFEQHTDYTLTAKVWGPEAGDDEEEEKVKFHVHPK